MIRNKEAKTIAKTLVNLFCEMGIFPVVLRSDNAAVFVAEIVKCLNKELEIKHLTGSSYHPQSQGAVESMHRLQV